MHVHVVSFSFLAAMESTSSLLREGWCVQQCSITYVIEFIHIIIIYSYAFGLGCNGCGYGCGMGCS